MDSCKRWPLLVNIELKMERICSACLSVDRKLSKLEELQFFYDLLIPDAEINLPEVRICWECRNTLRKCSNFQRNALTARDWLISYCLNPKSYNDQDLRSQSYSTLETKIQTTFDCNYLFKNTSEDTTCFIKQENNVHGLQSKMPNQEALSNVKLERSEVTASPLPDLTDDDLTSPSPLPAVPDDDPLCEPLEEIFVDPVKSKHTFKVPMGKKLKLVPRGQMPKQLIEMKDLPGSSKSNVIKLTKLTPKQIQLLKRQSKAIKIQAGDKILQEVKVSNLDSQLHSSSSAEVMKAVESEMIPKVKRKKKLKQVKAKKVMIKPVGKKFNHDEVPIPSTDEIYERFRSTLNDESKKNFKIKVMTEEELMIHRYELKKEPQYANSQFKCRDCIVGYYTEQQLQDHTTAKHFEPTTKVRSSRFAAPVTQQCPTCRTHVPAPMFAFHYGRHRVLYECVLCGAAVDDVRRIGAHARTHEEPVKQTVFECKVCRREFGSRHRLKAHKETHQPGAAQRYTCEVCGKGFGAKWSLEYHVKRHSMQQEPVKCRVCKKEYKNRYTLASHFRNVHDRDPSAQYRCEPCNLRFVSAQCLATHQRHARVHVDPARFKHICSTCGKGYMSERHLRDHDNYVHKGQTEYVCMYCNKMYSSAGGLRKHVRFVHEGVRYERNKKCNICGKAFTSPKTLREHQNIHNGTRPFKCPVCGDTFKQSAALYTHRRLVHLGYKMRNKKIVKQGDTELDKVPIPPLRTYPPIDPTDFPHDNQGAT